MTAADLIEAGERIFNVERLYNLREGFAAKDDYLPRRFLEEPMAEGPSKGYVPKLDRLLEDYYAQRGWDKHGNVTPEKLEALGLTDLSSHLK